MVLTRAATLLSAVLAATICIVPTPVDACDIYDRQCWEAKRQREALPDASGYTLAQRAEMCQDMALAVEKTAQQVLKHVYARHLIASPTGRGLDYDNSTGGVGYLDPGFVHQIEREITTTVNVTARDIRSEKYEGANLDKCAAIAQEARMTLWAIRDALP